MFTTQRRVEFRDTDAAGIVHFSAFFPMMESAEHEMLRSWGIQVLPQHADGVDPITWPRVAASCEYLSAARFEDVLAVGVRIAKLGKTSVAYEVLFRCGDRDVARGQLTAVCCRLGANGKLTKTEIPGEIRDQLGKHQ